MKASLKIVIFDGSLKTTPFINRLAEGLSERHEVTILGFSSNKKNRIPKVKYVSLGSSSNLIHLLVSSVGFGLKNLFIRGAVKSWLQTKYNLVLLRRNQLKIQNFKTSIALIQPDILHVQWPSLLPWVEHISLDKVTVILSQRGYQNNVRPFLDSSNFAYLQKMYPKLAGFHSVSEEMAKVGDIIYSSPKKINRVVYSGFDFKKLPFNRDYKKHDLLRLLSIGRPHWIKGYSYAIECCNLLKRQGVAFSYHIVGARENEELLYLIHEHGLENDITLLAKVSQEEVYQHMLESDVLLFPSIKEGLPNVVVEAMALGLPVISTDCGGVANLLANDCGDLVPTRDSKAMAEAVLGFSKRDIASLEAQRLAARNKVETQHGEQKMISDMEALYLKCMESVSD